MKNQNILRILSIVLLVFNGVGACFGGYMLVKDPTGQTLQMPVDQLQHSPFSDYFIPGMILLTVFGVGSMIAAMLVIVKVKSHPIATMFIGIALTIWILTQMFMLQSVHFLHLIYGGIGIVLIILGEAQWKRAVS
jgi:uncharacterized membrane protein YphA (DoxX/SURF4 family)